MKRFLCLLLTVCLALPSVGVLSVFADDSYSARAFREFTAEVSALIEGNQMSISGSVGKYYGNSQAEAEAASSNEKANVEYTNRLVVKSHKEIDSINAIAHVCGYNDLHVLQFKNTEDFIKAYKYYLSLDSVEFVQEDLVCEESVSSDEVGTPDNLIYDAIPTQSQSEKFGYNAVKKYIDDNEIVYDNDLIVAVVDTGVCNDHDFLKGRVIPTGFNSINPEKSCYDDRGHGTHVAGIIVANTIENVKIKPYKVLGADGKGTALQVYLGIQAAVEDDVDVINLSLSVKGENALLHEAVTNAHSEGIITVAAAGNDGINIDDIYCSPACFDEVITVMACDDSHKIPSFSNYGTKCDFAAPGEEIISTYINNAYRKMSGTSMATPFITAAVTFAIFGGAVTKDKIIGKLDDNASFCIGNKSIKYVDAEYLTREKAKTSNPVFSYRSSTFTNSFDLSFTCKDADATIYYNTSLMDPGTYEVFTEPISVCYDMTVTAFAVREGSKPSYSMSYSYTRAVSDASLFTVDENGALTGYTGDEIDIVVPRIVNGIYVNSVADGAFENAGLRSVGFLPAMTTIGNSAFKNCDSLEYIRAAGCAVIGDSAFEGCDNLTRVNTSVVERIGDNAFKDCHKLNSVNLITTQYIGESAFENTSTLTTPGPNSIIELGDRAFYNSAVTSISLDVCTQIGKSAFAECTELEYFNSFRITEFPENLFYNCESLSYVSASSVSLLSDGIFDNCNNLLTLKLNSLISLKSNSGNHFIPANCPKLSQFWADSLTGLPDGAFKNAENLVDVSLLSLEKVGNEAFYGCYLLDTINSTSIKYIGDYAFYGCTGLVNINVNDAETLGKSALGKTPIKTAEFKNLRTVFSGCFDECNLEKTYLNAVSAVYDLPDQGFAVISPYMITLDITENDNCVMYVFNGTTAHSKAETLGLNYIVLTDETTFVTNTPKVITDASQPITVDYIGLNSKCVWYGLNSMDYNNDDTKRSVATGDTFVPADSSWPYYCCVITNTFGDTKYSFESIYILNRKYKYYYSINDDIYIDSREKPYTVYVNDSTLHSDIFDVIGFNSEVTGLEMSLTHVAGGVDYLATGTKATIKVLNTYSFDFQFIIKGDVNQDGVSDVLDVQEVERSIDKSKYFVGCAYTAANVVGATSGGTITVADYQEFVNQFMAA